jgi:glycosyltransferase involved in cell wall biosynthesis
MYEAWHAVRWPKVESATGHVDVVHATAVAVPPTRAPLLVTIHDLAFLDDPQRATRHGHRFFRRGAELARRCASLVVVPSDTTARACVEAGFDGERIRVVPWGVSRHDIAEADVERARRRFGLDRPYVLFVGTVEPRKNLSGLVEAVATLDGRGIDLVVVGPTGWNEDLAARVSRLDRTDVRVHRLGFLAPLDLASLYAGCAVFCYPSLEEGFGLPVLEAMAYGAPVVTSAGTATEEVAGDGALVVNPCDHAGLGAAIGSLLDDRDLAAGLGRRGQARAASYTWERAAASYADIYAELAS